MKIFKPINYQAPLDLKKHILPQPPEHDDQVPMDVVFVGAGPAGLAGAIHLKKLIEKDNASGGSLGDIEVGVLEKASSLGGHNLSGAVLNPRSLKELFPELNDSDFPFRSPVQGDSVYYLSENSQFKIPTPPTMHNEGNHVISICELVRWMGEKAEGLGIHMFTSFPVESLLTNNGAVTGVKTVEAGLKKDKSPGTQHMPGTEITARVTVLSEGTRGLLTQSYCQWKGIESGYKQIYALGVKEVWKVKKAPTHVTHTMGWPLQKTDFGGSFIYPMGDDMVSVGLVVGMDYKNSNTDVHKMLQQLKKHPLVKPTLEGGELLEWGAKTIPEGGWMALPDKLSGDGLLLIGDCAGLVNVPALKGIHYAIQSGIYAAESIFEALKKGDVSERELRSYDEKIKASYIASDLKKVRNMRQAFKSGFISGGIKAGLMTLTSGSFPGNLSHTSEDANEEKYYQANTPENPGLTKVDAVFRASNKTRDDIPSHLEVGKDIPQEVAEMYVHMCPAGVYEIQEGKLVVNAPNCIDCKATDVIGPRWEPREGGSGPNYRLM